MKYTDNVLLTLFFFFSWNKSLYVPEALKCRENVDQPAQALVCFWRHDRACRVDVLNRAGLVQQLSHTHSETLRQCVS